MTDFSDLHLFNKFYTDYHSRFVFFANSYVRDIYVAEDIVNESFILYWENKTKLTENSNERAYVLTIIKNKCINYLKQKEVRNAVLSDMQDHMTWELSNRITTLEACNPDELFSDEVNNIVKKTLAQLPSRTANIFIMSRYKNNTHKEIAEKLNISIKGVEFHITKALVKLRKNLKDYVFCLLIYFFS